MAEDRWSPPDLSGQVAVVTGASRGIGRGIAEVLASCGARAYLVARQRSSAPEGRSGTLDEVAEAITSAGGDAIVAPCDVRDDDAVRALFDKIAADEGHIEILVNNAVAWEHEPKPGEDVADRGDGGPAPFMWQPPWHAPRWWWDDNFTVGVRSHWIVTNAAAPLMTKGRKGVVFFTSELRAEEPGAQEMVLDLRGTVIERMALLFSLHLRPHLVCSILLYPGFVRTDVIDHSFEKGVGYFDGWTRERYERQTCSLGFPGRAAAMLAADPNLLDRTGHLITAIEAAEQYSFTDVNGKTPEPL